MSTLSEWLDNYYAERPQIKGAIAAVNGTNTTGDGLEVD